MIPRSFLEDLTLFFITTLTLFLPILTFVAILLSCYFWSILKTILISSLYGTWMYLDRYTDIRGGRWSDYLRQLSIWSIVSSYFPIKLIKTEDLEPNRNYIFGYHPHGTLTYGAGLNFLTEATHFSTLFPGIRPHLMILRFQFLVPFSRELFLHLGSDTMLLNPPSYAGLF